MFVNFVLYSLYLLCFHENDFDFLTFVPKETQSHDINKLIMQIY